jgi:hypothetical protein
MVSFCTNESFARVRFIIKQFRVPLATKYRALTHCMNVSYAVGHERTSSVMFEFIVSIL